MGEHDLYRKIAKIYAGLANQDKPVYLALVRNIHSYATVLITYWYIGTSVNNILK